MSRYQFRIPASTSNLGSGFDALGLALARYLHVSIEPAAAFAIEADGINADTIPTGPHNLMLEVAQNIATKRARKLPPFRLSVKNEIHLARGLGSSAAAILAGITCYELMAGDRLTDKEIFNYAFYFEPHADNLAAALYGGLISAATGAKGEVFVARLSVAAGASTIVVIPEFKLSTAASRRVLPRSFSRADTVYNIQRAALTIAALTTGTWSLLREAMRDRIHQSYRAALIPGLDKVLDLNTPGLLAIALSGAGPAVFAVSEPGRDAEVGGAIVRMFDEHGVRAVSHTLEIDVKGRVITES